MIGALGDDTGGDNAGSAYLFDVATGQLFHTLNNPTPQPGDVFGSSVSLSSDYALIGAYGDDTGAGNAGSAYLFDVATGALLRTFNNPSPQSNDRFGASVSTIGNSALVGADYDDTGAVNGGSAYLFRVSDGQLFQTLNNPTPESGDRFGEAVSLSDDYALVGARWDDAAASNAGSAYLFKVSTGELEQIISNPTPQADDLFGASVSLSRDFAFVGAIGDDTAAINSGSSYVLNRTVAAGSALSVIDNRPVTIMPGASEQFTIRVATSEVGTYVAGYAINVPTWDPVPEGFTFGVQTQVVLEHPARIDWVNRGQDDGFEIYPNPTLARAIVDRAIADWEQIIKDFNYHAKDADSVIGGNTFQVELYAGDPPGQECALGCGGLRDVTDELVPIKGSIFLDPDPSLWFFDPTPHDDWEYDSLQSRFSATGSISQHQSKSDFYTAAVHELCHVLGLHMGNTYPLGVPQDTVFKAWEDGTRSPPPGVTFEPTGDSDARGDDTALLYRLTALNGLDVVLTRYSVLHVYEESATGDTAFDLMTPGYTFSQRKLISDTDAMILEAVYGYEITLPSQLNTFLVDFNSDTGDVLVRGEPGANDTIFIEETTSIVVTVNGSREVINQVTPSTITVDSGEGDDLVDFMGLTRSVTVYAGEGIDIVRGGLAADWIYGGEGDDLLYGNGGDDFLFGDDGADTLDGGTENDTIFGGIGDDRLVGQTGCDRLYGEDGNDILHGGQDTEVDELFGGFGRDEFYPLLNDIVGDFIAGEDAPIGSRDRSGGRAGR